MSTDTTPTEFVNDSDNENDRPAWCPDDDAEPLRCACGDALTRYNESRATLRELVRVFGDGQSVPFCPGCVRRRDAPGKLQSIAKANIIGARR